jgi:transposase
MLEGRLYGPQSTLLRDPKVAASAKTIAQSLAGDYPSEHLFTLRQSLPAYRQYQKWITDCDVEIEKHLRVFSKATQEPFKALSKSKGHHKPRRNEPRFDLRSYQYRIFGVDLTSVPGVSSLTVQVLLTEVGPDLSKFANAAAFASCLGLCPDNRISGGRILSAGTRKVNNRLTVALRMAALALHGSQSHLGQYFRRMKRRLGTPAAVTATAHKLARILFHLITTREAFDEGLFAQIEQRARQRQFLRLQKRQPRSVITSRRQSVFLRRRNPFRCQAMTVAGFTIIRADFQSSHI